MFWGAGGQGGNTSTSSSYIVNPGSSASTRWDSCGNHAGKDERTEGRRETKWPIHPSIHPSAILVRTRTRPSFRSPTTPDPSFAPSPPSYIHTSFSRGEASKLHMQAAREHGLTSRVGGSEHAPQSRRPRSLARARPRGELTMEARGGLVD